jgi:prephenate dehydrogenase
MKILILGAGKMGSFFCDLLSFDHEVAVLEKEPKRMRFVYNALRMKSPEEIPDFNPDMVINCVTLNYTVEAFKTVIPYLKPNCIISDIASVKTNLQEFYLQAGLPYVSTHPMFGPTFANLANLEKENTIIISEGDHLGRIFFKDLYGKLKLNIFEYTFEQHDRIVAYSLGIPFASTLVFAGTMVHQDAPGTTFKRHIKTARGLLSEDDYLLTEILFNPRMSKQIDRIQEKLTLLKAIIDRKDTARMKEYLEEVRKKIFYG